MVIDQSWRTSLELSFTRRVLWLETSLAKSDSALESLLKRLDFNTETAVLLSNRPLAGLKPINPSEFVRHLGTNCSIALFDCFAGLNPNTLAQLAGTIVGGGVLILISPPKNDWLRDWDPEYSHLGLSEHDILPARFLHWFTRHLESSDAVIRLNNHRYVSQQAIKPIDAIDKIGTKQNKTAVMPLPNGVFLGIEQQILVLSVLAAWRQPLSCVLIDADRGRGKSSALGLALALQASFASEQIALTAPDKRALNRVTAEYLRLKPDSQVPKWMAPAELLKHVERNGCQIKCVVIDEAAGLPINVLSRLAKSVPHILLASTQHGYEGFGSGYGIRFIKSLEQQRPETRRLSLKQSLRWASPDPLEMWVNDALLLSTNPVLESVCEGFIEWDIQRLTEQPGRLAEIYQLLAQAHYRTSPADLRVLLDAPGQRLFALYQNSKIIAVIWIAEEGEINADLAQKIAQGRRRPAGNLLPQSLIYYLGWLQAGDQLFWRVVRIAVQVDKRRLSLARKLLEQVEARAARNGVDFIGASFTGYPELCEFWQRCGFTEFRKGDSIDQVAAVPASQVLKASHTKAAEWLELYTNGLNYLFGINNLNEYYDVYYRGVLRQRKHQALTNFAEHFAPLSLVKEQLIEYLDAQSAESNSNLISIDVSDLIDRLKSDESLKPNQVKRLRAWLAQFLVVQKLDLVANPKST